MDGTSPREQKIRNRIKAFFDRATNSNNRWAGLVELRQELPQVKPSELDEILKKMAREGRINLVGEPNRKVLTDRDHAAAVRFGGEDNHLFTFQ